jgi:hypothetical protein
VDQADAAMQHPAMKNSPVVVNNYNNSTVVHGSSPTRHLNLSTAVYILLDAPTDTWLHSNLVYI